MKDKNKIDQIILRNGKYAFEHREELNDRKRHTVTRSYWGYLFILPFFITYFIFSFLPLLDTIRYSFFEYYRSGLKTVGPNWVGLSNYTSIMGKDFFTYLGNTLLLWLIGFIPQLVISLLLATWFTDVRVKINGKQFFKVVIYLPNLIMASAFAMLFFTLFSNAGPVNSILLGLKLIKEPLDFMGTPLGTRLLIGLMNFLMWFGNTTIMLTATIMGISPDVFEAAEIDGCTPAQRFFCITLPMIRPILAYTLITSLLGGLQMFDVPQILTNGQGNPNRTSYTLIMWLNNLLHAPDYGRAGALSVFLFIVSGIFSLIVYRMVNREEIIENRKIEQRNRRIQRARRARS